MLSLNPDYLQFLIQYGYDDIYASLRYNLDRQLSLSDRYWYCVDNNLKMSHMRLPLLPNLEDTDSIWEVFKKHVKSISDIIYHQDILDSIYDMSSMTPGIYWYGVTDSSDDADITQPNILVLTETPRDELQKHCLNYYTKIVSPYKLATVATEILTPTVILTQQPKSIVGPVRYYCHVRHSIAQRLLYLLQAFKESAVSGRLYIYMDNTDDKIGIEIYKRYASQNIAFVNSALNYNEYDVYINLSVQEPIDIYLAYVSGKALMLSDDIRHITVAYIPITCNGDNRNFDVSEIVMYLKIIDSYPRYLRRYMGYSVKADK